jgi:hypothetical protein
MFPHRFQDILLSRPARRPSLTGFAPRTRAALKKEKQNKKPPTSVQRNHRRERYSTQANAQSPDAESHFICALRNEVPQGIIKMCSASGFPDMLSVGCHLRYGAVCLAQAALPGILFCFASRVYYMLS